ncbi:hypothetical protein BDW60DRAFT_227241 [Aspergillus nidulans var. acristatus]
MTQNHYDLRDALFNSSGYLADLLARCAVVEEKFYRSSTEESSLSRPVFVRTYHAILQYTAVIMASQNASTGEREIALPTAKGAFWDSLSDGHRRFCLDNTRVAIRHQISEWFESSQGKYIFWLNGMARTGKSTIARTVARSFSKKGRLGASFFFNKNNDGRANATQFITTIAKQLILYDQQLALGILSALNNDSEISAKTVEKQFEQLVLGPLRGRRLDESRSFLIVIDALDKCKDDHVQWILELLPKLRDVEFLPLEILVTSRPEVAV